MGSSGASHPLFLTNSLHNQQGQQAAQGDAISSPRTGHLRIGRAGGPLRSDQAGGAAPGDGAGQEGEMGLQRAA